MSAPPPSSPSSSPAKAPQFADQLRYAQQSPTFKFEPSLPPSFSREAKTAASRSKRNIVATSVESPSPLAPLKDEESGEEDELDVIGADTSAYENGDADDIFEVEEDEDPNAAVARRIAQGGSFAVVKPTGRVAQFTLRFFITLCMALFSFGTYAYKTESSSIGYCDTGKDTNKALEIVNAKWQAIEACNLENRTFLQLPPLPGSGENVPELEGPTLCPPPALIPYTHATYCTPCPKHATCKDNVVKCETGFIHKPHLLISLLSPFGSAESPAATKVHQMIADATNGLPFLGPVAFPGSCVEDQQLKKNIGALGRATEKHLSIERGDRLCRGEGLEIFVNRDGGEAKNWGIEINQLKEEMKKKTPVSGLISNSSCRGF